MRLVGEPHLVIAWLDGDRSENFRDCRSLLWRPCCARQRLRHRYSERDRRFALLHHARNVAHRMIERDCSCAAHNAGRRTTQNVAIGMSVRISCLVLQQYELRLTHSACVTCTWIEVGKAVVVHFDVVAPRASGSGRRNGPAASVSASPMMCPSSRRKTSTRTSGNGTPCLFCTTPIICGTRSSFTCTASASSSQRKRTSKATRRTANEELRVCASSRLRAKDQLNTFCNASRKSAYANWYPYSSNRLGSTRSRRQRGLFRCFFAHARGAMANRGTGKRVGRCSTSPSTLVNSAHGHGVRERSSSRSAAPAGSAARRR